VTSASRTVVVAVYATSASHATAAVACTASASRITNVAYPTSISRVVVALRQQNKTNVRTKSVKNTPIKKPPTKAR
jgi:hypothetical protein